jgi:hypothetical protein
VQQQAQSHEVADEAGGDDRGAELVTHLACAAHERLLLCDAAPLASQHVPPDIGRVPAQGRPHLLEVAESVVEHGAAGYLGEGLGG